MQRKILLILIIVVLVSAAYFFWPRGVPEEKETPGNETIVPETVWCIAENSSIITVTGLRIDRITEITVDENGIVYCTTTTKNNGIISTRELVSKDGSERIYEQYDEKGELESKTVISEGCTVVYDRVGAEISRICR